MRILLIGGGVLGTYTAQELLKQGQKQMCCALKKGYRKMADSWILKYDRFFDRCIDNSKILRDTQLNLCGFVSVENGIKYEIEHIKQEEIK